MPVPKQVQSIIRSLAADERVGAAGVFVREHPSRDGALIAATPTVCKDVASEYGGRPVVRYIGSDASEDRHYSTLDQGPDAVITKYFEQNPAFCWGHQYGIPLIGNCVGLDTQKTRTVFDVEFLVDEWDLPNTANLSRLVYRLASKNRMPASSVGFIPHDQEEYTSDAANIPWFITPTRFKKWELLELSSVAIPSNRNALKKALADGELSDNEVDFLGLSRFMQSEAPMMLLPRAQISPLAVRGAKLPIVGQRATDPPTQDDRRGTPTHPSADELRAMTEFVSTCGGVEQAKAFIESWRTMNDEQRVGAVLSRRNKTRLQSAADLIDEVLSDAEPDEPTTPQAESEAADAGRGADGVDVEALRSVVAEFDALAKTIGGDPTTTVEPQATGDTRADEGEGDAAVDLTQLADLASTMLDFRLPN